MTREEFRLECLKIAHTHGREATHVVERAKAYEQYIFTEEVKAVQEISPMLEESAPKKSPGRPRKTIGNLNHHS